MLNYIFKDNKKPENPIIFLHGFFGHVSDHHEFEEKIKSHDYYAVHFPGHNSDFVKHKEMKLKNFQQKLIEFIKSKNLRNATLIGHSMGGAIALGVLNELQDYIKSVILVCPFNASSFFLTKESIKFKIKALFGFSLLKNFSKNQKIFLNIIFHSEKSIEKMKEIFLNYRTKIKKNDVRKIGSQIVSLFLNLINPFTIWNLHKKIKKISKEMPFLLIVGADQDLLTPTNQNLKYLKKHLKNLEIAQIKKAGHMVYIDNYDDYEFAVYQFLKKYHEIL